jgi:GrpB-like predicted nucleotidyltransferase (UPF0157 family)/predicted enzyme related to lactoylglutathione lyase
VADRPRELRLVVTAADFDEALRFYRDVLGLEEVADFSGDDGRVRLLSAGRATVEIVDAAQAAYIDDVEVGRRVAGPIRVAFEVADVPAATRALVEAGATEVAPPTRTPWQSLNARLDAPAGLHLTLFDPPDVYLQPRARLDGQVHLAEADPAWITTGAHLVDRIRSVLGDVALRVEHVGSTSVPGLPAKPVIDVVLAVPDADDEAAYVRPLEAVGYVLHIREPEWHRHRLLKLADPSVNLHVFPAGSPEVARMIAFRDHLRRDATDRARYLAAKRDLATRTWAFVQDYADAKTDVVADILSRALPPGGPSQP